MQQLIEVLKDIVPYILLIILSIYIEFKVKYRMALGIENFYIRGIRIITLIVIAIKLNEYGAIYTYISFVLTYIICVMLDRRYRNKIEECLELGRKNIDKYMKSHKELSITQWIKFRYEPFKKAYKESYDIFTFKFNIGSSILFITLILTLLFYL